MAAQNWTLNPLGPSKRCSRCHPLPIQSLEFRRASRIPFSRIACQIFSMLIFLCLSMIWFMILGTNCPAFHPVTSSPLPLLTSIHNPGPLGVLSLQMSLAMPQSIRKSYMIIISEMLSRPQQEKLFLASQLRQADLRLNTRTLRTKIRISTAYNRIRENGLKPGWRPSKINKVSVVDNRAKKGAGRFTQRDVGRRSFTSLIAQFSAFSVQERLQFLSWLFEGALSHSTPSSTIDESAARCMPRQGGISTNRSIVGGVNAKRIHSSRNRLPLSIEQDRLLVQLREEESFSWSEVTALQSKIPRKKTRFNTGALEQGAQQTAALFSKRIKRNASYQFTNLEFQNGSESVSPLTYGDSQSNPPSILHYTYIQNLQACLLHKSYDDMLSAPC